MRWKTTHGGSGREVDTHLTVCVCFGWVSFDSLDRTHSYPLIPLFQYTLCVCCFCSMKMCACSQGKPWAARQVSSFHPCRASPTRQQQSSPATPGGASETSCLIRMREDETEKQREVWGNMLSPSSLTRRPLAGGREARVCVSACLYVHTCSCFVILVRVSSVIPWDWTLFGTVSITFPDPLTWGTYLCVEVKD